MDKFSFTQFQKKVYREVLKIPLGEIRTYKEIAEAIGDPLAARAVGNALNKNPFTLLIPCHRVVGSDSIGGYSKGVEEKRRLLELERKIKEMLYEDDL